ncbi:MAG: phosphodiester glycosidase family protein [Pyrinomonadaceae bacterium]
MAIHHPYSLSTFRVNLLDQARFWIFILCVLCALRGEFAAQDFKAVYDGVEYAGVTREFSGRAVKLSLLRLDLKKVRLDVHHALDAAIGTETTSSIAKRRKAVAAINAGFFRLDTSKFAGDSVGLFVVDGKILSEPTNERIQLMINNRPDITKTLFMRAALSHTLKLGTETFQITGINRERKVDDLVLYTPEFGRNTLTEDGLEFVIQNGIVISSINTAGNSVIPPNGYVISASGTFRDSLASVANVSDIVALIQQWKGLPSDFIKDRFNLDVVTGVPQLIKNGKIDITWEQEKSSRSFVETRHPRTAVAKLGDGKFLMLTADGRSESSAGLDLYDLAAYLLELGATDAMNLDGGGSTTMFLDGKVVNTPSDKEGERKVSDAILVTLRKSQKSRTKK